MGSLANWFFQDDAVGKPVMEAPTQSLRESLRDGGRLEDIARARVVVAGHLVPPILIQWSRVSRVSGSTSLSTDTKNDSNTWKKWLYSIKCDYKATLKGKLKAHDMSIH